jgi:hypothetical protein
MMTYKGQCFCGTVQIEVAGAPAAMGYCHCRSCRSWSGGPVNAFTLWQPSAVKVTAGADQIVTYQKTPLSQRQSCKKCGGHLMTNHPPLKLVDVFAATQPTLKFAPAVHVNYAETVLSMRDGLPKLKDFPKEFGGSGETVPE